MTIHHDSNTCCGGTCCDAGQPVATTQIGMDMVIYKLTKDGAPVSVFAVDTMPVDGISPTGSQTKTLLRAARSMAARAASASLVLSTPSRSPATLPTSSSPAGIAAA